MLGPGESGGKEPSMGSSSVRERIAIVFMTLSVVATLVLGGALAAQLGHPKDQVVEVGAASSPGGDLGAGEQPAAGPEVGGTTDTTAAATGEETARAAGAAGGNSAGTATAAGGTPSSGPRSAAGTAGKAGPGKATTTTRAGSGPSASSAASPAAPGGAS